MKNLFCLFLIAIMTISYFGAAEINASLRENKTEMKAKTEINVVDLLKVEKIITIVRRMVKPLLDERRITILTAESHLLQFSFDVETQPPRT